MAAAEVGGGIHAWLRCRMLGFRLRCLWALPPGPTRVRSWEGGARVRLLSLQRSTVQLLVQKAKRTMRQRQTNTHYCKDSALISALSSPTPPPPPRLSRPPTGFTGVHVGRSRAGSAAPARTQTLCPYPVTFCPLPEAWRPRPGGWMPPPPM